MVRLSCLCDGEESSWQSQSHSALSNLSLAQWSFAAWLSRALIMLMKRVCVFVCVYVSVSDFRDIMVQANLPCICQVKSWSTFAS